MGENEGNKLNEHHSEKRFDKKLHEQNRSERSSQKAFVGHDGSHEYLAQRTWISFFFLN